MDYYEIWFDLKDSSLDLQFTEHLGHYMEHLQSEGLITGWRLKRRKLGLGPGELGEFNVTIETRDLTQLEAAFQRVGTRQGKVESFHSKVYKAVNNLKFGLYRDFPDSFRGRS